MPPAAPAVSPVPLGYFVKEKDLNEAVDAIPKTDPAMKQLAQHMSLPIIEKTLKEGAFNLDPLIIVPSPFAIFAGKPDAIALQLYNAIGLPNPSAAMAAKKLTNVLKDQMKLISGFYIGFLPPGSLPTNNNSSLVRTYLISNCVIFI